MKSVTWITAAVLALAASAASAQDAASERRAAVLPFINATGTDRYDSLCDGLATLVAGDLAAVDGFVVVERRDLDMAIAEQRFQHTGVTPANEHARFGKLLGAELLVVGTFTLEGKALRIDVRAISVSTARVAAAASAAGPVGKLLDTEKRAVNELVRRLAQDDGEPRGLSVDDTPGQTLHYIRGLGHFFENQFEAAIAEFMILAAQDQNSERARYWLACSYYELKDYTHCSIECRRYLDAFPDGEHAAKVRAILEACEKATETSTLSPPARRPTQRVSHLV